VVLERFKQGLFTNDLDKKEIAEAISLV